MPQTNEQRRVKIEEHQNTAPSNEAVERKTRSIKRLKKEGVPVIDHLPVIEDSRQARIRTTDEIAKRAIAICLTSIKGEGLDQADVESQVHEFEAGPFFSPQELAFIKNPEPTQLERIQFSWRYECYWVLLWALGYVERLKRPDDICNVAKAVKILLARTTEQFIKGSKLRPITSILDEADLIYRYHWATVDARVKGAEMPANLEGGVVHERHYVLNWLTGYMDQEWDDVSTDT